MPIPPNLRYTPHNWIEACAQLTALMLFLFSDAAARQKAAGPIPSYDHPVTWKVLQANQAQMQHDLTPLVDGPRMHHAAALSTSVHRLT